MKKSLEITLWTLAFFAIYLPTSYAIDWYFGSKIDLVAMTIVGIIFAIVLVVCLVFELPEKLSEKVKSEEGFEEENSEEELDKFFEKTAEVENETKTGEVIQSIH